MRVALALLGIVLAAACGPDPLERARRLHGEGRFEEARALLSELVRERGDEPEVHYLYGVSLLRTGRPSEGVWPLRRAMESETWKVAAGLQLAGAALRTANPDEAVEVLGAVLEEDPEHTGALLLRAMARVQTRRDYEGALEDADRLLALEPDHEEILPQRAIALLGLGRAEEAEEALRALERSTHDGVLPGPAAGAACGARAKFAEESGEVEEAERRYRACLEQFPADALLLREAVAFFDGTGRPDEATDALRDALAAVPQVRGLRVAFALRLQRLGDAAAAEALLREATRDADPLAAASAHVDLAGFLADHERLPEAVASYERALALLPEARSRLLFPFADVLIRAGQLERALALADEMTVPGYRHLIRGRALLAGGDAEAALDALSRGLARWPEQAAARYYAGLAAEQLGDLDRAIEEYRYATRAGSLLAARMRLARVHHALGEPSDALVALRHDPANAGLEVEAALLELEILTARTGSPERPRRSLQAPELRGRVVAAIASGIRRRAGPEAAARAALGAGLDLADPEAGPALEGLVRDLCAAGTPERAIARLDEVRDRAPERALLYALHAEASECAGDAEAARAGFERALALDDSLRAALWGRARRAVEEGDLDAARPLYERALDAEEDASGDPRAALAIASALDGAGHRDEAIRLLEGWRRHHPLDPAVATRLSALLGDGDERARRLAHMARRLTGADRPPSAPPSA